MLNTANYPNNDGKTMGVARTIFVDAFSQGVFTGEEATCKRVVNDRGIGCGRPVLFVEKSVL